MRASSNGRIRDLHSHDPGSIPGARSKETNTRSARACCDMSPGGARARSLADQATVFETVSRKFDSCRARQVLTRSSCARRSKIGANIADDPGVARLHYLWRRGETGARRSAKALSSRLDTDRRLGIQRSRKYVRRGSLNGKAAVLKTAESQRCDVRVRIHALSEVTITQCHAPVVYRPRTADCRSARTSSILVGSAIHSFCCRSSEVEHRADNAGVDGSNPSGKTHRGAPSPAKASVLHTDISAVRIRPRGRTCRSHIVGSMRACQVRRSGSIPLTCTMRALHSGNAAVFQTEAPSSDSRRPHQFQPPRRPMGPKTAARKPPPR